MMEGMIRIGIKSYEVDEVFSGVRMKRCKSAIVVIIENSQMAVTLTKFWNFFNGEKYLVRKLEKFEKGLLLVFTNVEKGRGSKKVKDYQRREKKK